MRMNTQETDTREESEMCRAEENALMESWHELRSVIPALERAEREECCGVMTNLLYTVSTCY